MITNALVGQMKAVVDKLLTDTCTIEAEDFSTDELGAPTNSWTIYAADVACRVVTVGSRFSESAGEQGGQETIPDTYRLIVPQGTGLDVGQRVTVASTDDVYQIVDLMTERTSAPDEQAIITRAR